MQVIKLIEYFPEIEQDLLRRERQVAYEKVKKTVKKFDHARQLYLSIEDRYFREKREFERIDRELAMIDGRYQVVERRKKGRKSRSYGKTEDIIVDLSVDKIAKIAAILGVELGENNS